MCGMGNQEDDFSLAIYKPSNFTSGCLEIRLFYVRIAPCAVEAVPDHLTLRHLRREIGVSLEINGSRVPASESASISLRRDRVNRDSAEVTYVSTDSVRISGAIEFEVHEELLMLCGSLERVDATWTNGNAGWSMNCYMAAPVSSGGVGGRLAFFQPKLGTLPSTIEVYIAGCCSGVPVILTKVIHSSPRRKVPRHVMLDAIPEDEEVGKEHGRMNGLVRQRKVQIIEADAADDESVGKSGHCLYSDDIYADEDGQLSWFNAGVRVGVGIGLGMCLGAGIGVGLLMHSYQATTRSFRRRFF